MYGTVRSGQQKSYNITNPQNNIDNNIGTAIISEYIIAVFEYHLLNLSRYFLNQKFL